MNKNLRSFESTGLRGAAKAAESYSSNRAAIAKLDRVVQPIRDVSGWSFLNPIAFYWTAGRLYVGYGQLARFHEGEQPLWDPYPIKPLALIHTTGGFYQLTRIDRMNRQQYGRLEFNYVHRDIDADCDVRESYTLFPFTYLEIQWLDRQPICRKVPQPRDRKLEQFIRSQPTLNAERSGDAELRTQMEQALGRSDDRERMIEQYAYVG